MSNTTALSQALITAEQLFASLKRDAGLELLGATPAERDHVVLLCDLISEHVDGVRRFAKK